MNSMSEQPGEPVYQLAVRYLTQPSLETLRAIHAQIRASAGFNANTDISAVLRSRPQDGAYQDAVAAVGRLMPGAFLSATAHGALARAYQGLGDGAALERERTMARVSISSALSTGDGSRERPWWALRVSDEYDVLRALGKTSASQELSTQDERRLDHHVCTDDSEVWFVLDPVPATTEADA